MVIPLSHRVLDHGVEEIDTRLGQSWRIGPLGKTLVSLWIATTEEECGGCPRLAKRFAVQGSSPMSEELAGTDAGRGPSMRHSSKDSYPFRHDKSDPSRIARRAPSTSPPGMAQLTIQKGDLLSSTKPGVRIFAVNPRLKPEVSGQLDPLRGLRGKGREKDLSVPLSFLLRLMMKSGPNAVRGDTKRLNVFEMGETEEQKWGKPSKEEN
ncbi:uncharacterized protein LOC110229057 [Arabidopsis lyrata subsp. lyrata]|uniref:uncharacterized protein LOC110229057 n=1 Tax=Arabidopsis lyrata subsp. lyrata TaxID=81972 RepID=UPI000A29C02B|nr:uncharacterized protein LOC110229057 [Arabidopsis lyrata subsp. lyrata]|eukprot:XP_020883516.1 uncharacterized protein LOC110229057 [Arabidopsis lyrata subsp. lyrata]